MRFIKLLLFIVAFIPSGIMALKSPETIETEAFPSEETLEIEEEIFDETEVPYEDFSKHSEEEPPFEQTEETGMTLESTITNPVITHPLLSLETTGSIFDQFAEFEKNKLLMTLQTDEEKMQLERDRVKLQRLKLKKELAEFEEKEEPVAYQESDDSDEEDSEDYADDEEEIEEEISNEPKTFSEMYSVKTIMGVGKKLIAVLKSIDNESKTRVKIGTEIEGYTIRKIQPKKGIVVSKNGQIEEIGIE